MPKLMHETWEERIAWCKDMVERQRDICESFENFYRNHKMDLFSCNKNKATPEPCEACDQWEEIIKSNREILESDIKEYQNARRGI